MYTSEMLVAMLGPSATPVVQAPVRRVVHVAMPGQVVYFISSPMSAGYASPVVSSPTVIYSQPAAYVVPSSLVGATYTSPVVISGAPVIYSSPVYSGSGVVHTAPVTYSPVTSVVTAA